MASRSIIDDTSPEAREVLRRIYAAMSATEKIRRLSELTLAANQLTLVGLRSRHPSESERSLLLRLARIRLGEDLARRVYGEAAAVG